MKRIRILLVGDRELYRRGVRSMLEPEEDLEIVGDCASAEEALLEMEILSPDIILMEAKMPGIDGIEATRTLKGNGLHYDGEVIILGESESYQAEALEAGAADYLLKDMTSAKLAQSIREVYWRKQSPKDREGLVEEVDLVIPSPVDAVQLLRFVYQVEEVLAATIMQQVGSWDEGVTITLLLRRTTLLTTILDRLERMPDVDSVREEPLAKYNLLRPLHFPKKILVGLESYPRKELLVTLKSVKAAKQTELAGIVSQNTLIPKTQR